MSKLFCLVILSCLAFACVPSEESDGDKLTGLEACTQMLAKSAILFGKCDGLSITAEDVTPMAEQECAKFSCDDASEAIDASQVKTCIDNMKATGDCADLVMGSACDALEVNLMSLCNFEEDAPTDTGVDTESDSLPEDMGTGDPDPIDTGTGDPVEPPTDEPDTGAVHDVTDYGACTALVGSMESLKDKCVVDMDAMYKTCDTCDIPGVGTNSFIDVMVCAASVTVSDDCSLISWTDPICEDVWVTSCSGW